MDWAESALATSRQRSPGPWSARNRDRHGEARDGRSALNPVINQVWTVAPGYLRVSRMERERVQWGMGRAMARAAMYGSRDMLSSEVTALRDVTWSQDRSR
jgi:hypothetical protein